MAQPYVTGPVHVFVGVQGAPNVPLLSRTPVYLGTGERGPIIEDAQQWDSVFNDITGTKIPFDDLYEGMYSIIRIDLTRWNNDILHSIQSLPNYAAGGTGVPGVNAAGDVGSLMRLEGFAYPLWLSYPYYTKPAMASAVSGPMEPGRHYLAAWLEGPQRRITGTGANKVSCIFVSKQIYDPISGALLLYDYNMTALAGALYFPS